MFFKKALSGQNRDPGTYLTAFTGIRKCSEEPCNHGYDRSDVEVVNQISSDMSVRAVIAALYSATPYSYQTLNYPRSSLAFTHSDYVHFGTYPAQGMTAVWVALEDIHPDAGPLFYYPGSHKMPFVNMQDLLLRTVKDGDYPLCQDQMQAVAEHMGYKRATFLPKHGEALLWHGNLLHGGPYPVSTNLTRLSMVTHYHFYENEYGWHPVASRTDKNQVTYVDAVGVHQRWGRLPPHADGSLTHIAREGTCFSFPNSPCFQTSLHLGLFAKPAATASEERCKGGHGFKKDNGPNC
jgi:hypothetical protein